MGAWEEMSEAERKFNIIIDLMNTIRLLCNYKDEYGDYAPDYRKNEIMVYSHEELFNLAKELKRVPEIYEEERKSPTGLDYEMLFWYRGVKFFCYLSEKESQKFSEKIKEMTESLVFDEVFIDETDEEDDGDGDS